jgi:hypothetical protein
VEDLLFEMLVVVRYVESFQSVIQLGVSTISRIARYELTSSIFAIIVVKSSTNGFPVLLFTHGSSFGTEVNYGGVPTEGGIYASPLGVLLSEALTASIGGKANFKN